MNKNAIIGIILIGIFAIFILLSTSSKNATLSSNLKSACTCYHQGYESGLKGSKNLYGCYKGRDGNKDIRKAFNEGYWYGQKSAKGANTGYGYQNCLRKYCN